ncbi:MAG: ABC transporter ATP-binding protein, partial [Candidatus Competibacteraceae bacterium]|nr:ABC transporter ATP-binding protein [Candidatus Competibacteraceae bacterium]
LLHTLAGLRPPTAGQVCLEGIPLPHWQRSRLARRLGLLPQDHEDAFPATVLETALIGRHPYITRWRWEEEQDHALARRALAEVGLEGFAGRTVQSLSGGERRRLGVATLLTQDPDLLLLDEPTNHLDVNHQMGLLRHLCRRVATGERAWIMVTHDPSLAARFCDSVLLLFDGGEAAVGTVEDLLTEKHLSRLYRHPMVRVAGPDGSLFIPA